MKKLLMLTTCIALLGMAGSAFATLDWAGNVWPLHGSNHVPTGDIDVYAQVYKSDVKSEAASDKTLGITAMLYYTTDIAGEVIVPMAYFGQAGDNEEHTAAIPQAALVGATYVDVTVIFTDDEDGSMLEISGDQNDNPPPLRYYVVNVLPNDVTVHFTLCMSGEVTTGVPCVIGSAPEIGAWGTGVNMVGSVAHPDLYEIPVVFAAGGNPSFEYKFKKDGCNDWESVGNRFVDLPTDGTTDVYLDADSWNNLPMGCDMGTILTEDKVLCIQVCLAGAETLGGVCVTGNQPEFTMWGSGAPMVMVAPDLYQACFVYNAGIAIPLNLEFKFRKDGCDTWESVGNRLFAIDNTLSQETTVTYNWDNGDGGCQPVATKNSTWGTLKGQYR